MENNTTVQEFKLTKEMIEEHVKESIKREIRWRRLEIRAAAKKYAQGGLSVIPMRPLDKIPYIRWKPNQSTRFTPREIDLWWNKFPDAQIGIVTGAISNLVVLDFDGADAKDRFEAEVCQIPDTIMQSTGRVDGGLHALFSYPDIEIRNTNSKICENVDVKGEGGYFVISPSIHKSGKIYEWINCNPLRDGFEALRPLPDEVLVWWDVKLSVKPEIK